MVINMYYENKVPSFQKSLRKSSQFYLTSNTPQIEAFEVKSRHQELNGE